MYRNIHICSLILMLCCFRLISFGQTLASSWQSPGLEQGGERKKTVTLENALNRLEKQYEISVFYKSDLLKNKVVKNFKTVGSLEEDLNSLLKPYGLKYKKGDDNFFVIIRAEEDKDKSLDKIKSKALFPDKNDKGPGQGMIPPLNNISPPFQQDDIMVTGTVTSQESGEALPGVNILIKGTTSGTVTDINGNYTLNAPEDGILVFSFIGYISEEIPVGGRSEINIALVEDIQSLKEVVVVGYGTQKKTSLTSAVTSLSGEDLAEQSTSGDLRKTLQGMAPGLAILDNGGQPGDNNIQMRIRGVSSVNGSGPLVLVDGQVQSLNTIDPNAVESISILKDAASTAIYGSRGSNGIILVTTKKGEKGKLTINYEGVYGLQRPTVLPEFLSTEEYFRFRNDLAANEKLRNPQSDLPTYTEQEIQDYLAAMQEDPINNPSASYDLNDIYQTAPQTRHSLTLSGGGDFVQSMLNMSYYYQEGTIWERNYERVNIRANNNINLSKSLSGHLNLFYQDSRKKTQASGIPEYEAVQNLHSQTQQFGLGGGVFYDEEGNYLPKGGTKTNPRLEADTEYMGLRQTTPLYYTVDIGLLASH